MRRLLTLLASACALPPLLLGVLLTGGAGALCSQTGAAPGSPSAAAPLILGPGAGVLVGATEYGGPGDPSSGATGARGDDLYLHPDSYAELGGTTWSAAGALGGLPYMTPLRISWGGRSVIAYKRDFGLGGGPVAGLARRIDLWWRLAARLGIPYQHGMWSGAVRIERLGPVVPAQLPSSVLDTLDTQAAALCAGAGDGGGGPLALAPGDRAQLRSGGLAAAPASAPPAVQAMIAAGNEIAGRPYLYGAAHGAPLSTLSARYDCSSSVEHLLWAAGLIGVDYTPASSALESFGLPGPGRWVTLYASGGHVFMYVAGLRWDTHDAAGPGDGPSGIGWHPQIRGAAGFIARHPAGL